MGDNCKGNQCSYYYYWWDWGGGSSWQSDPNSPCSPGGCDYSACENLEKRTLMSQTIQNCECKVDQNGYTALNCTPECIELESEKNDTIKSEYTLHTREKKYVTKTKTNYISMKEKTADTETRKIINKKFEITFKAKDSCKNCTQDQICCDNKCIDKDEECCENKADIDLNLRFEIYDNTIVVLLNNNANDKLCVNRGNYDLFLCPKVIFNSKNELLYMCDSVTSECTSCYTGEFI